MATLREIIARKATFPVILNEFIINAIICWALYGLCSWESNPIKWDPVTKGFAIFFMCVYGPYIDANREINKEKKEK
jgi:hypothetical protein